MERRSGLSSFASQPIEEVVAANPQTFFQIYWAGSREQIAQRLQRAAAAGAVGLIVTLDWSFSHSRDWGSPAIPERMDLRTIVKLLPDALTGPRWLAAWSTGRRSARPDGAEHDHRRRAATDVLRRLRRVDADAASVVG